MIDNLKQSTLSEIFLTEYELVAKSPHKDEEYFKHALAAFSFMQSFLITTKDEGWLFAAFLSQVKKHYLLAFLSIMRLHHVQATMNFRQVLESGVNAGYAMANPVPEDFSTTSPEGILVTSKKLQNKRYEWLEGKYPAASQGVVSMKKAIQSSAHSNIVDAYRNFEYTHQGKSVQINMPFFDQYNEFQVTTDFWLIGNIAIGLLDMFYGINQDCDVLTLSIDFVPRLLELQEVDNQIKAKIMATEKFKRANSRAKTKEARVKLNLSKKEQS